MTFTCPRCQMVLNADPEMAGKVSQCPACGSRLRVPLASQMSEDASGNVQAQSPATPARRSPSAQAGRRKASGWNDADPANVHPWIPLVAAVGATVLTLFLLAALGKQNYLNRVVFVGNGESVNYAEIFLFYWGLGIVFLKWRKVERQRSALMLDVLPQALGHEITPDNAGDFLSHIHNLPHRVRDSLMVNRIRKALEIFQARRSNSEASSLLSSQSEVDANRIAASYSIVKVFLWAIPILGFIGTVLGLSFAMAQFGGADLTNVDQMKSSVKAITGGLATAFNTTLLGLILSMILMFPMSAVQKREDDCLTEIDAFCNETLLPRLNDGGGLQALAEHNPEGFLEQIAQSLAEQQNNFLAVLTQTTQMLQGVIQSLDERSAGQWKRVEEQMGNAAAEVAKRTSTSVEQSLQFANKYFASLEAGIRALNETLAKLGEKQIHIQQVRKKGWFSRG